MVVRRKVMPYIIQIVWDSVRLITHQRLLANHQRLSKFLQKERPELTLSESEQLIFDCISEGILIPAPKGFGPQSYVIPTQYNKLTDDGHDWYCIECHLPGNVELCTKCHRVFHLDCYNKTRTLSTIKKKDKKSSSTNQSRNDNLYINSTMVVENSDSNKNQVVIDKTSHSTDNSESILTNDHSIHNKELMVSVVKMDITVERLCSICDLIKKDEFEIKNDELNYLSKFIFLRIKNWLPINIIDGIAPPEPEPWAIESDKKLRGDFLLYYPMDLKIMENKAMNGEYNCLNEIQADLLSIKHNVAVYHGVNSTEIQAADYMLTDGCHDIAEIRQCIDCYRNSNEKTHRRWFCIPCNPPHELVWAKQKGFSYWPAKVIKKNGKQYDVRFFGAKHLRAVIDENFVKPINIPFVNLKIKRSISFNKAYEELQLYQEWMRVPEEINKVMAPNTKNKKNISQKQLIRKESTSTGYQTSTKSSSIVKGLKKTTGLMSKNKLHDSTTKSSLNDSNTTYTDQTSDSDEFSQSQDHLISSTQDLRYHFPLEPITNSPENNPPKLFDNKNTEAADQLRRQLENIFNQQQLIQIACDAVQEQVDKFTEKIRSMATTQSAVISDIKKKQWCYNCEQEAIYHCCWNTSYCSTNCQQTHWHAEHKRNCRRKNHNQS